MQDRWQSNVVPLRRRASNGGSRALVEEGLEILAAYRLIEDPVLRRSAIDFVKAMAAVRK